MLSYDINKGHIWQSREITKARIGKEDMHLKRRVSPFVVAIPAFIIIAVFKVWPIINTFVLSFFKYNPTKGLLGEEFTGLGNYGEVFGSYYIMRILSNTIILTLVPALVTALAAFLAALLILKLPNRWTRCLALTVLAIPAFVPVRVLCNSITELVGHGSYLSRLLINGDLIDRRYISETSGTVHLMTVPALYPVIYTAAETLKYMFFPAAFGVLAADEGSSFKGNALTVLRVAFGYIIVRFAFFMFANRDLSFNLNNPMVYGTADIFTSFTYRKGILEANYGTTFAIDSIRIMTQLLLNLLLFLCLKGIINDMREVRFGMSLQKNKKPAWIAAAAGCILVGFGSIAIVAHLVSGIFGSGVKLADVLSNQSIMQSVLMSFIYSFLSAVLFTVISVLLAYPLTTGSRVYPVVLFLLAGTGFIVYDYLLFRQAGLLDSGIPVILSGGIQVWGALLIYLLARNHLKGVNSFWVYIKKILPMILVTFFLDFAFTWSSEDALFYIVDRQKYPVSLTIRELFIMGNYPLMMPGEFDENAVRGFRSLAEVVVSVPPVIMGWLLIWLNRVIFRNEQRESGQTEAGMTDNGYIEYIGYIENGQSDQADQEKINKE